MGAFEQARDELYGLDPDAFMARRGELAAAARNAGDALAAKQIGALRKPTRSAYAVNLLVRTEPDAADRLAEMGDELRAAQQQLDGAAIRELSGRRNKLVDELARAALTAAGKGAPAALRDEIGATIGAAIADPEILERVRAGALVRPERWDGIGVAAAAGPSLRLVRGDKRDERSERDSGRGLWPAPASDAGPRGDAAAGTDDTNDAGAVPPSDAQDEGETVKVRSAADRRAEARRQAKIDATEAALAEAEQQLDAAADAVAGSRREVRRLEDELEQARRGLDQAEHEQHRARQLVEKERAALDRIT